jgi:hypothetical protein
MYIKSKTKEFKDKARLYIENNRGKHNARCMLRYTNKLQRTPKWLSKLHINQIKCIYSKCALYRKLGYDFEVDHIIPLQGKTVSGLHVPWNLRIVPKQLNRSKSNSI